MSELMVAQATYEEAADFMEDLKTAQREAGCWLAGSPFTQRVASGQASREEIGEWARQMFCCVDVIHKVGHTRPRARLEGLAPEFKKHFWENRVEEEIGAISNTAGHQELLIRFGEAFGVNRFDFATTKPNAATRKTMDEFAKSLPDPDDFLPGAVKMASVEAMNPEASMAVVDGLRTHYRVTDEDIAFFTVHITADAEHGEIGIDLLTLIPKEKWPEIHAGALEMSQDFYAMYSSTVPGFLPEASQSDTPKPAFAGQEMQPVVSFEEAEAFMEELQDAQRDRGYWIADNAFPVRVAKGIASRDEIAEWCKQMFLTISLLHKLAHSRPRARLNGLPREFKKHFWENRVEEEIGALSDTAGHQELLMQCGGAFGLNRMDFAVAKPDENTRRVMDTFRATIPDPDDFLPGAVRIAAQEAMNPEANAMIAEGLKRHYGCSDHDVRFFSVHVTADAEHGDVGIHLLRLVPKEKWAEIRETALEMSRDYAALWGGPIHTDALAD
jgi:pyrroloquinoline-quinone synthase